VKENQCRVDKPLDDDDDDDDDEKHALLNLSIRSDIIVF
jgi:hypothetical protein